MAGKALCEQTMASTGDWPLDWRFKAIASAPGASVPRLADIGRQGWNVLRGDLQLPVLVLKEDALAHNLALMSSFVASHGFALAPHGKTTMSPRLVARQVEAGAWGVTVATASQGRVYRAFGVKRILIANQLVDRAGLAWAAAATAADPSLELLCLVDSVPAVELMDRVLGENGCDRPLKVLVELGAPNGRCGCRDLGEVEAVSLAVKGSRHLALAGIEGYEGVFGTDRSQQTIEQIDRFLIRLRDVADSLLAQEAVEEPMIISAGGSAYPDRVVDVLGSTWKPKRPVLRLLRSGGYVTHDSGLYARVSPFGAFVAAGSAQLHPALEAWGVVLSRPEAGLAVMGLGRRDVPYDVELPFPLVALSASGERRGIHGSAVILKLDDHHAYIRLPESDPLIVGDLVGCAISHPCTAFDKWSLVPIVDDEYNVIDAVTTHF